MATDYQTELNNIELPFFVDLYDISFPSKTFYLTTYHSKIEYNSNTYVPSAITRSTISKQNYGDRNITLSIAITEEIKYNLFDVTVPKIRVIIRRYFLEDSFVKVLFVGDGNVIGVSNNIITLKVNDILSLNKSLFPPYIYSAYCNHSLFDLGCKVNPITYRVSVTASYVNGNPQILYADAFKTSDSTYFVNGYVNYENDYRLITNQDSTNGYIYLHAPFDEDIQGKTILVYPGCDKTPETCKNRFNNLDNYLGFPYIPTKNPVMWGW